MDFSEIKESLSYLDDWEDRYKFVIELGNELQPLDEGDRVRANKVEGCVSQVWLAFKKQSDGTVSIFGDSDAMIVKGLVAIVVALFSGKTPKEMSSLNAIEIFDEIGLREHLTSQRANGLRSMIDRVELEVQQLL